MIFSTIPFSIYGLSISDSIFEATSGITATGATILKNLSEHNKGILLWRSILHFIGGIGIIIFAVALSPLFKNIPIQKLFYSEFSDKSDKLIPHTSQIAINVLIAYLSLIIICTITYYVLGMNAFDAICHALSTIATGGFTNYDNSFGYYNSALIDYAAVIFMILGSLPFIWYLRIIYSQKIVFDEQVLWFTLIVIFSTLAITMSINYFNSYDKTTHFFEDFRYSLFSVVSLMSTTGFTNSDYSAWNPHLPGLIIFFLMFLGGCTGSTAGGIKMFRIIVSFKNISSELKRLINPFQVTVMRFNNNIISESIICSMTAFLALYFIIFIVSSFVISMLGFDYVTSISAAAATLTNAGPGLGEIVGPSGNYSSLPDTAKIILSVCMLLGRLEIIPIITFFIVVMKGGIKWENN
jgi:trk system potassium uptake protein TrkH